MVMRTVHGIGDWGIISAMPDFLKKSILTVKYMYHQLKCLENLFSEHFNNWNFWNSKFGNAETIFKHNPYVDDFVDQYDGEIFHDHYRIYDNENIDTPLVEQMLSSGNLKKMNIKILSQNYIGLMRKKV